MDNTPLTPASFQRLGTRQPEDALARHVQGQLGLQPAGLEAGKMSASQWRGWVSVRDTQSPTSPTVGDAPKESCLLVTGNGLQSNRDEPLDDNSAQQAPSTSKEERPKAEALGTKSKEPRVEAMRTQNERPGQNP